MPGKQVHRMPEQYYYHGLAFPRMYNPPDHMDRARDVQTREGYTVIITYPRTGTTFSIQLVSLLQCADDQELAAVENTKIYNRVCFLELIHFNGDEIEKFEQLSSPRIIKSHMPAFLVMNWLTNSRCVSVIRNPKDTPVSLYHFVQGIPTFGPFSGTWVEFFTWYQDGSMFNGDCLDWSLGMWKERHHPNVHLMFYEDMVKNLKPETQKLAEFLGLERTEEQIDKVVQKAQFSSMKNNKATNYEEETFSSGFQFVRSGRIGEWKEYFTPEQNEWMDARIAGKLAGTGLTFQ